MDRKSEGKIGVVDEENVGMTVVEGEEQQDVAVR
jgi:hypothetical protein